MDGSVRVQVGPAGQALAVKRAAPPTDARLRHEAAVLERIAGPGVVRLGYIRDRSDGTVELATIYAGPRTLADVEAPRPVDEVAALGAAIASALARAHAAGTAHGRLTPDHVLLGAGGAPVLCGWGGATAASSAADDVAALGKLLLALLPPARPTGGGTSVRTIATNCVDLEPGNRPPMSAIAAALRPGAPPPTRRTRLPALRAVALTGAALAAVTSAVLTAGAGSSADTPPPVGISEVEPGADDVDRREPSVPPAAPRRVWPTVPSSAADGAGPVLEHGGARYAVGGPGDIALAADWSCSGAALPIVVRPATGAVFAFEAWPDGDDPGAGRAVAEVGPAVDAVAEDVDGDGCTELVVTVADGTTVAVRLLP